MKSTRVFTVLSILGSMAATIILQENTKYDEIDDPMYYDETFTLKLGDENH